MHFLESAELLGFKPVLFPEVSMELMGLSNLVVEEELIYCKIVEFVKLGHRSQLELFLVRLKAVSG